jgi:hypothetical protein
MPSPSFPRRSVLHTGHGACGSLPVSERLEEPRDAEPSYGRYAVPCLPTRYGADASGPNSICASRSCRPMRSARNLPTRASSSLSPMPGGCLVRSLSMDPRSGADPQTWRCTAPAWRHRLADAEHTSGHRPPGSSTRERLGGRAWFSQLTNGPSSRLRRNTTSFSGSLLSKSTRTATAQRSASSSSGRHPRPLDPSRTWRA